VATNPASRKSPVPRRSRGWWTGRCKFLGGLGVTDDSPVAKIYREIRGFRIYDGASEVHRWAIARRLGRQVRERPGVHTPP